MPTTALIAVLALLLFVGAVLLVRTAARLGQPEPVAPATEIEVHPELLAEHLSAAIRCQTISGLSGQPPDGDELEQLQRVLERWYPRLHEQIGRERINEFSLLYTWRGTRPDLPGILLCAHQDVVPVDPSSADQWSHPPFGGEIAGGYVWGRGALDLKSSLTTQLDAVEYLLVEGYRPERTIYLAFGHDEELGGAAGAGQVVEFFKTRGTELAAVLDEGGMVLSPGLLPGVDAPVALVGVAEKGYLALRIWVEAPPGHSSMPPGQTAIGILSAAIARLEASPLPARLGWVDQLYRHLGSAASFGVQMVFANRWVFGRPVRTLLSGSAPTNAAIRTTTAATLVQGGIKENVLPQRADAVINFRLMPGDTQASVLAHARRAINDRRVRLEPLAGWEASPRAPAGSAAYAGLRDTIRSVFNNLPVAPYLVAGATDARRYAELCEDTFRFTPYMLAVDDIARIHGIDERIAVPALGQMVRFYVELIRTWAGGEVTQMNTDEEKR